MCKEAAVGPGGEVASRLVFNSTCRTLDAAARAAYVGVLAQGWVGAYAPTVHVGEAVFGDTMQQTREFAVRAASSEAVVVRFQLTAAVTLFGRLAGQWEVALQQQHVLTGGGVTGSRADRLFSLPALGRQPPGTDLVEEMRSRLAQSCFYDIDAWLQLGLLSVLSALEP